MLTTRQRWLYILSASLITTSACAQVGTPLPFPRLGEQQSRDQGAITSLNTQAQVVQTVTAEPTATAVPAVPTPVVVNQPRAASAPSLDPRQLVSARRGDIVNSLQLSGRVVAVQEAQLTFGTKGIVDQVLVAPGQPVNEGDVLVTLDTHDVLQQLSDARSALQITILRLQQLQQSTAAQSEAQQQLATQQQADAARQSALNQQKQADAIAQAEDQLRLAQQALDQVKAGAAQSERLAAQAAVTGAAGTLAKAQADLAQLQASPTQAEAYAAQQTLAAAQIAATKAQADRDKLMQPPDPVALTAAKKDLVDAQATVAALSNPVVNSPTAPKMSDAERQARMQSAQLAVAAAQAHLFDVQKPPDASAVQLANMAVDSTKADLAAARAHLDIVKAGPTQVQLDAAQNALQVAQIGLSGAQARLAEVNSHPTPNELADAQAKVDQAQQALDRASQPLDSGSTPAFPGSSMSAPSGSTQSGGGDSVQIQTLQLQHTAEQQQSQIDSLQAQLAGSSIKAAFDGTIESVQVHPGDPADPKTGAVALASNGAPVVVADVADPDVGRVINASGITVQLDSSTSVQGSLGGMAVSPNGSGQQAQIRVDWPAKLPDLGATLQVNVALDQHKGVILVPQRAIHAASDRRFVEILDGADRKQVDVTVGIVSGDDAEIASGLNEGQIVILPA
jgi:multidrug efflux pump subunit AcrA (membrane-fusion protein)